MPVFAAEIRCVIPVYFILALFSNVDNLPLGHMGDALCCLMDPLTKPVRPWFSRLCPRRKGSSPQVGTNSTVFFFFVLSTRNLSLNGEAGSPMRAATLHEYHSCDMQASKGKSFVAATPDTLHGCLSFSHLKEGQILEACSKADIESLKMLAESRGGFLNDGLRRKACRCFEINDPTFSSANIQDSPIIN